MFDFNSIYEAKSIDDAVKYLWDNPDTWIIAGGTDTVIAMREGHFTGRDLISINCIEELEGITIDADNNIHIKPNTTFRQIADSSIIKEKTPYLIEATETIGSPQIRNAATIGGNISNGFTTADSPPMLFALDTKVVVTGTDGSREISIADYYVKSEVMDLKRGELLTDIIIPYDGYNGYTANYIKYAVRKSLDIVLLGCAVSCRLNDDKTIIDDIRIAFSAAGPVPLRALNTEKQIIGKPILNSIFEMLDENIESDVSLRSDMRASKEFRLHLCKVLSKRALKKALADQNVVGI